MSISKGCIEDVYDQYIFSRQLRHLGNFRHFVYIMALYISPKGLTAGRKLDHLSDVISQI